MFALRELAKDDIKIINQWRNNKELINFLGAPYRYINLDVDSSWYENYLKSRNNNIRCAIVEEGNSNEILGLVSLMNINYINRTAEFHIMIGENKNQNKGMGFQATKRILEHAFYDLNLNRVELGVLENNTRAINMYEKVGFIQEGIKRKSIYKNDEYLNLIIMGILKEDFI